MDCMDYMKALPDRFFDLVIADPPYFSGPERRAFYGKAVSTTAVARKEYPVTDKWKVPTAEVFDEIKRVSKHYIVWGCNYFDYVFDHGRIVWDKCNGNSSFSDCEIAATNLFDSVRMFRFMWNGMLQGKSIAEGHIMQGDKSKNEFRIHPTQKPVALYGWIFQNYSRGGRRFLIHILAVAAVASRHTAWGLTSAVARLTKCISRLLKSVLNGSAWALKKSTVISSHNKHCFEI